MKCGILFFSAIIGCLILYIVVSIFHAAPLRAFLNHEQKIILIILCSVFVGFWVALANDILAIFSPITLGNRELSFTLTEWRAGGPDLPTYDGPPIGIRARFFVAYPWCLLILTTMIVRGLSK